MMLISVAALLLAAAPAAKPATPICQDNRLRAIDAPLRAGPRKLGEEPPARQIYTVLRTENGCSLPVPVNDRVIGSPARR